MAVVKSFEKSDVEAKLNPTETQASYRVGQHRGDSILQIRTVGSEDREFPRKGSQTLQLTRQSAYQLLTILRTEFGFND